MKTMLMLAFLFAVMAAPVARADDAHHADDKQPVAKGPRAATGPRVDEKSMKQMQEHMAKMQDLMAKMQKATNPAERQQLMDEHMRAMGEGMAMMCGRSGGMMQGMMDGNMMQHHHHPQNAAPK